MKTAAMIFVFLCFLIVVGMIEAASAYIATSLVMTLVSIVALYIAMFYTMRYIIRIGRRL